MSCDALNDCNGHTAMDDGRIIVIGGGCGPVNADRDVFIFDPAQVGTPQSPGTPWTRKADMISARWYPTALIAPNGKVASFGGQVGTDFVQRPEVYNPLTDSWQQLLAPGGSATIFSYPYMFLLHDGRIFWAGHGNHTGTIDLTQTWPTWTMLPPHSGAGGGPFHMYSGSAVTYAPGKILKCGGLNGINVATRTTAMIDFTASGTWTTNPLQSQMVHARADHNLVLLPTGHILAVGGHGVCESPCPPQTPPLPCNLAPVMTAEWIDPNVVPPQTPTWTELAAMSIPRGYHSTAVLLPDATVLFTGGEDWFLCPPNCVNPATGEPAPTGNPWPSSRTAQIYKPPYLFQGPRPVITAAPSTVTCCTSFSVTLASAVVPNNVKVNLIRPGMPSHGFDQNQRLVPLTVTGGTTPTTTLTVSAPVNLNHAPPGDYMLFVVHNGVPSVATYVRVAACLGNLDDCCFINGADLAILLGQWGTPGCGGALVCSGDLNNDGNVDGTDLALLLGNWGTCPGGGASDTCGAGAGGGGEAATAGTPSAPGSGDCGGGIDLFQHWLDTGDMDAFWQWLNCVTDGAAAQ